MSVHSALFRRPGLDPGPRCSAKVVAAETAGPRIKSGATSAFWGWASQLTVGALVEQVRQRAVGLSLPARHAQVVQAVPVGPGSRLLVVEFAGRRLLVGQSRAGLSMLAEAPVATLAP